MSVTMDSNHLTLTDYDKCTVCVSECVCLSVRAHAHARACVCVCVSVSACMCTCVCMHACVQSLQVWVVV